ncbi:hypothetical protein LENED_006323 [Lentinula edodes]|uniref:DUF6534 domain-containing protein n=1 Tax=Lentinula edodes TaxID=5353 RepID=A0A1Q3EBC1_LENED|nr:hypothetical protein LENED_006323 [Lentinula edodes]
MADVSTSSPIPYETVASTLGIWVISFFLATILYGMGVLQAWLYFHWYPQDGWKLKSLVLTVLILETVQVTTFFAATYNVIIKHFGDWAAVLAITWLHSTQLLAGIEKTTWIYSLLSACTFSCDVLIAFAIYVTLTGKRTAIQEIAGVQYFPSRSNTIIRKLIIYAINRGVLTAIAAAVNLILFLAMPNTFYYFIGLLTSSKRVYHALTISISLIVPRPVYMNSMLAALNSRQYISQSSEDDAAHCWNSIPVQVLRSETRRSRAAASSIGYNDETSIRDSKLGFSADSI